MFLDTPVVVELLRNEPGSQRFEQIFEAIEEETLYISVIQLGEVSDWCFANELEPENILNRLKEIGEILPLSERTVMTGSRLKHQARAEGSQKFSLIDGIILASALDLEEELLTFDTNFRPFTSARVLE